MPTFFVTTPRYDEITTYFHDWSEEIIREAMGKRWGYYNLDGRDVTKENFKKRVNAHNPNFILLNGHGAEDRVCGDKICGVPEPILKLDDNEELTKGRIIYARACGSLEKLGKACVEKGAIAYIGYKKGFAVVYDANKTSRPLEDEVAKPFMEISNAIPSTLIKGHTVEEALKRSTARFWKNVEYYETHYDLNTQQILYYLFLDMAIQGAIGDLNAKV